jgi:hypothetical protein
VIIVAPSLLSNEIDRDGVETIGKNGVLKLTLLKSKDATPKKITVRDELLISTAFCLRMNTQSRSRKRNVKQT